MPVIERSQEEPHFTEGEPDLEPPEELAVGELDEDTILEEELDNEDVLEEDVDEEILTATLEDLVYMSDADGEEAGGLAEWALVDLDGDQSTVLEEELEVLEVDELEDVQEGLDHVLEKRLGDPVITDLSSESAGDVRLSPTLSWTLAAAAERVTPSHGDEEFVCRGCFLVRHRALLVDAHELLCRDCAG